MGLSIGKIITGVATGGLSTAYDELGHALNPGTTSASQVPLETPEQRAAREALAQFMKTGTFNNFTAGADIGIKGPNTGITGNEQTGQNLLSTLLQNGVPSQYAMGDTALKGLLTADPNQIQAQFDPFKAQVQRQIAQSNKDLTRSAGFAGNLYSTNTVQGLGDIQARGNETLTSQLASLTNSALDRQLQAVPLAYQSGNQQQGILQSLLTASQQYGSLPRDLSNQGIDAANQEILRKRAESTLPLQTATNLSGTNAQFGVPTVTTPNANPTLDLLTALIGAGGKIFGGKG